MSSERDLANDKPSVEDARAPARNDDLSYAGQHALARGISPAALQRKIQRRALQGRAADAPPGATGGTPLPDVVRGSMEHSLGGDFSAVRVHEDSAATAMNARAFTRGDDIHFAPGEYQPGNNAGRELIGHELAHVMQQRAGRVQAPQGKDSPYVADDSLEQEADVHGAAAARGEVVAAEGGAQRDGAAPRSGDTVQPKKGKPALETEKLEGTLYAKDKSGNDLPPAIEDVNQGQVGDCFLFAAMASIVNTAPKRITSMIEDHKNGSYTVKFKGIGKKAKQTVSSIYKDKHGQLGKRKALWPLVIEKAYMQQKGGFDKVDKGGNPGKAMDELTDDGIQRFKPRDKSGQWIVNKLAGAKKGKHPATASTPDKKGASKEKMKMVDDIPGLHFNHAYSIVDVDTGGKKIKLYNPWGFSHPNETGWLHVDQFKKFYVEVNIND